MFPPARLLDPLRVVHGTRTLPPLRLPRPRCTGPVHQPSVRHHIAMVGDRVPEVADGCRARHRPAARPSVVADAPGDRGRRGAGVGRLVSSRQVGSTTASTAGAGAGSSTTSGPGPAPVSGFVPAAGPVPGSITVPGSVPVRIRNDHGAGTGLRGGGHRVPSPGTAAMPASGAHWRPGPRCSHPPRRRPRGRPRPPRCRGRHRHPDTAVMYRVQGPLPDVLRDAGSAGGPSSRWFRPRPLDDLVGPGLDDDELADLLRRLGDHRDRSRPRSRSTPRPRSGPTSGWLGSPSGFPQ